MAKPTQSGLEVAWPPLRGAQQVTIDIVDATGACVHRSRVAPTKTPLQIEALPHSEHPLTILLAATNARGRRVAWGRTEIPSRTSCRSGRRRNP